VSAQIFAVANQKGGVGKTTTSVNVSAALARLGQRVLLVDLDPQGNATMGSGIDKHGLERSVYPVLLGEMPVAEAAIHSESGGYDVLAANRDLAGAEIELVGMEQREHRLANALAEVANHYDYVTSGLPAVIVVINTERTMFSARRNYSYAVRILCVGRPIGFGEFD